jgi:ABC-type microcin C transport system duplicated ATPase subunit YejF
MTIFAMLLPQSARDAPERGGVPDGTAGALVTGPALTLVGPPGSGKSTVGRLAADRLGVRFHGQPK